MRALVTLALVALVALAPLALARAQDTAPSSDEARALEARTLFEEGVRASREERWAEALDFFRRSRALVPRPSTLFNVAIALDRLGRVRASIAAIDEYLAISDPEADAADRREAMRLRVEAEARLARLVLRVDPRDARVTLDGAPLEGEGERATPVDPGDHVIVASAPGRLEQRLELTLRPGAEVERVLALAPAAVETTSEVAPAESVAAESVAAPPPPRSTSLAEDPVFWAILGAGVAVAAGVAIGVGVHVASAPQPYGGTLGVTFDGP